jgi:hypothetical protein
MIQELEGWRRYGIVFGGGVATAFICTAAVPFLVASTGTIGPTALQAQSPASALVAMLVVFGIAAVMAGFVGKYVNAAVGLFVLGAGLWALRLRSATAVDMIFAEGSVTLVAVETALWGFMVLGATWLVFRIGGPLSDITPADPGIRLPWWKKYGLHGAACGVLMVPVIWLVARSPLQGQTLMAGVCGGMAAGLVGRLVAPHTQPLLLFASPCFFGAAATLIAGMVVKGSLADAYVASDLPLLILPMPIDYAAGSLMGVSMGLGWAKGFLHHEQ